MSRFESRESFEHLDKLSYEIGPRLAGSDRSRQAADYIRDRFEDFGLEASFQDFEFVDKVMKVRIMMAVLIGVFVVSLFSNFYLGPLFTLLIVLGGYGLAYGLPEFLPKEVERNVVGDLSPDEGAEEVVLIGAHFDSADCRKGLFWSLFYRVSLLFVLAIFVVVLFFTYLSGTGGWLLVWGIMAVPYVFVCGLPFWIYEDLVSPGADDNASGVSVMLELARLASKASLNNTEIRFVAFGAEEQGLAGSKAYVDQNESPDFLINLDSIGSGDCLAIIRGNGIFRKHPTSEKINQKIDNEMEVEKVWAPFSVHDHIPFLEESIEATTLSSIETSIEKNNLDKFLEKFFKIQNPKTKRHSQLHTVEDVPEKIKLENIEKTGKIVKNILGIEFEESEEKNE